MEKCVKSEVRFRQAEPAEDLILAQHFYQLWRDNQVANEQIRSDWQSVTLQFMREARLSLNYRAFVVEVQESEKSGYQIVGSASCQLFAGLYPLVLADSYRKYGYIWGVYVEPDYRGRGFAKSLTQMTVDYLQTLGCTRVILHASPAGKPVYQRLGFGESTEMRLDL